MMKLFERPTDEARETICDMMPDIESIMADEAFAKKVKEWLDTDMKGKSTIQFFMFGAKVICYSVPYLLRDKAAEVYRLVAAYFGVPVSEIKEQPLSKTIKMVREAFKDEELIQLFS